MPTVSGRITLHGSKPARTATVELHNASGDVVDQVQTDDDGRFAYHLVAGEWSVWVWVNSRWVTPSGTTCARSSLA